MLLHVSIIRREVTQFLSAFFASEPTFLNPETDVQPRGFVTHSDVVLQTLFYCVLAFANGTLVLRFTVHFQMKIVVLSTGKFLRAKLTGKWCHTSVSRYDVIAQMLPLPERGHAGVATVGSLGTMDAQMVIQMCFLSKRCSALLAFVGLCTRVNSLVNFQSTSGVERFTAFVALEDFFLRSFFWLQSR